MMMQHQRKAHERQKGNEKRKTYVSVKAPGKTYTNAPLPTGASVL
jgi:hypothetical protein